MTGELFFVGVKIECDTGDTSGEFSLKMSVTCLLVLLRAVLDAVLTRIFA